MWHIYVRYKKLTDSQLNLVHGAKNRTVIDNKIQKDPRDAYCTMTDVRYAKMAKVVGLTASVAGTVNIVRT